MDPEKQKEIFRICRDSYKRMADGELKYYKDMAQYIKTSLEKTNEGSFHVIVGK